MVKKLLKKVFPIGFLKKCFLYYNTFRIKTIDKLLFPEYPVTKVPFIRDVQEYPFQTCPVRKEHFEGELRTYMDMWDTWPQSEYIVQLNEPCLIEPDHGWAIVGSNALFYPSLGMSRTLHQPKPRVSPLWNRNKKIQTFDRIVSLRDTGEENYFHFYNDVLGKLVLLADYHALTPEAAILISDKLYKKPYFQFFLENSSLRNYNWIVQTDFYVKAERAIFCKPTTHRKAHWHQILQWAPFQKDDLLHNRKVFLTRNSSRRRFIENNCEVEVLCVKHGFEVVDADELTLPQQITLFAQTRYLIGIHGAGLTNMIYRRGAALSVLELFPPPTEGYLPFHYILLANQFGYHYNALIGEESKRAYSGGFVVNLKSLENQLLNILKS